MKKIFLGDLGHTSIRLANNFVPLNIGFLNSYLEKKFPNEFCITLFKDVFKILSAIKQERPDVLALSNYIWNSNLSIYVANFYKKLCPKGVVVFGGPNFPNDIKRIKQWLINHENVDFVILGEAEKAFSELIKQVSNISFDIKKIRKDNIKGVCFIDEKYELRHEQCELLDDINEIPSPYLMGILDDFILFETCGFRLYPIIEGYRGCPFSCTFCCNGNKKYIKDRIFKTDRLMEEIDYIASFIKRNKIPISSLLITDQNFGILKRDKAISEHLKTNKNRYGFPLTAMATTSKIKADQVIDTVMAFDGIAMTMAAQSLDKEVLKNIRRKNFPLNKYLEYQNKTKDNNKITKSDVIMGLPGDTREKHLQTLNKLMDIGIGVIDTFSFMMLLGTVEEDKERRKEFSYQTMWRLLPGNFTKIENTLILDYEEVVISTNSFNFEDYKYLRRIHLLVSVFYNGSMFFELKKYLKEKGISLIKFLTVIDDKIKMLKDNDDIKIIFSEFTLKTTQELFDSPEKLCEFYNKNQSYNNLISGKIAENLLQKYRYKIFNNIVKFTKILLDIFLENNKLENEHIEYETIRSFLINKSYCVEKLLSGQFITEELSYKSEIQHDILTWRTIEQPLSQYKTSQPLKIKAFYTHKQIEKLNAIIPERLNVQQKATVIYRLGIETLMPTVKIEPVLI